MAEVFGTVGTVAGLVSLGLQLCAGLTSYIDAVRGRKEDLAAVAKQVQDFQRSIEIIRNAMPNLTTKYQAASTGVPPAITSCEQELRALHDMLGKLEDSPAQSGSTAKMSITDQKKRLTFPFHRPNLERLQERLQRANDSLQTAMQVLEL